MKQAHTAKHRIAGNLLILASGQIVTWILSVLYLLVLGRYLGPSRLGQLSLANSLVAIFALMIPMGTGMVLIRTVARTPERAGEVASIAVLIRCLLTIPIPIVLYIYGHLVHLDAATSTAVNILILAMLAEVLFKVVRNTYHGQERMGFIAAIDILTNLLLLGGAWLIVTVHGGVEDFAGLTTCVWVVALALGLYFGRETIRLTRHIAWRDVLAVMREGLGFWATAIFLTIYFYIDSVILGILAGTEAVGFYAPATRVFSVAFFVPGIISTAVFPILSRLSMTSDRDFAQAGRKSLALVLTCGIPLMVGLFTLAGPIITLLYGSAYGPSTLALMVLALCIPCTFLNGELSNLLVARGQQWRWTAAIGASCVLNPALNFILVPFALQRWQNGALGAAIALLATEIFMSVYATLLVRDVAVHARLAQTLAGACLGGVLQLAIVWIVGRHWILAGEALGAAAYLALVILLGVLPRQDLLILLDSILSRLSSAREPQSHVEVASSHGESSLVVPDVG